MSLISVGRSKVSPRPMQRKGFQGDRALGQQIREFKVQEYRFRLRERKDLLDGEPGITPEQLASERIFEGYASTWDTDQVWDRIERGAFAKTIQLKFVQSMELWGYSDIPLFRDHQENIGITLELKEDQIGLLVRCRISKTRLGEDTLQLMLDKAITRMSIGYFVMAARETFNEDTKEWTRIIEEIELLEVSAVTFPANNNARIKSIKSRYSPEEDQAMNIPKASAAAREQKSKEAQEAKAAAQPPHWITGLKSWTKEQLGEVKAGRRLSQENADHLLSAYSALGSVLLGAGYMSEDPDDEDDPKDPKDDDDEEKATCEEVLQRAKPGTCVGGSEADDRKSLEPSAEAETKENEELARALKALQGFSFSTPV